MFTLSASFPIIAITLTNNMKNLLLPFCVSCTGGSRSTNLVNRLDLDTVQSPEPPRSVFCVDKLLFPTIAIVPPVMLALATENLQVLVGITGSYAGALIQYVVPALLVHYARRQSPFDDDALAGEGLRVKRSFMSPFKHHVWIYFTLAWAAISIIFVTIDHIFE